MPLLLAVSIYPGNKGHSSFLLLEVLIILAALKALAPLVEAALVFCNYHFFPYLHLALLNKTKKKLYACTP